METAGPWEVPSSSYLCALVRISPNGAWRQGARGIPSRSVYRATGGQLPRSLAAGSKGTQLSDLQAGPYRYKFVNATTASRHSFYNLILDSLALTISSLAAVILSPATSSRQAFLCLFFTFLCAASHPWQRSSSTPHDPIRQLRPPL